MPSDHDSDEERAWDAERLRAQVLAKMDQAARAFMEGCVPFWRQMYLSLVAEGFTEFQALELVKAHVATSCRPPQ